MDVHRVLDNWTLTQLSFEEHILPHEIFKKILAIEEMERICLKSNKYAQHKGNHLFMMTKKSLSHLCHPCAERLQSIAMTRNVLAENGGQPKPNGHSADDQE